MSAMAPPTAPVMITGKTSHDAKVRAMPPAP
jgi:hypothetical protein